MLGPRRASIARRWLAALFVAFHGVAPLKAAPDAAATRPWPGTLEAALDQAGTNRQALLQALDSAPARQRDGLVFLLTNMPPRDLRTLSASFLLENLSLSYQAMDEAPWAGSIPADRFLNDVLPYASMNEPRDNWRRRLYDFCRPLVQECKTPGEAGRMLNQKIFGLLKVRYSRTRRAPDQGPFETIESGVATCTGLSILLVDACRSVGVPARIAATPRWSNNSGNHTWVEIWDGDWHFTGAAEQDPKGLDRGWFAGNASKALRDDPLHAIFATSFRKTGLRFPIVWADGVDYVSAINVTATMAFAGMCILKSTTEWARRAIREAAAPSTNAERLLRLVVRSFERRTCSGSTTRPGCRASWPGTPSAT